MPVWVSLFNKDPQNISALTKAICREGTEGKSLSINPGTRGVKEVYLNLMHKVRGQPDKKVSVSLSAGEMVVLRRLSEVRCCLQAQILMCTQTPLHSATYKPFQSSMLPSVKMPMHAL